ncbi:hypothetical protein OCA5_pOC16700590 (plasmid) [Afipia carboxidovorans OM5]|uniref:Uncharacterized protein n=1 Tax=Afipia carboxidovorans (strain ATCC 49405 / DSM 1227 / KCTC 32145 / OM5) TaxID=504832 RepID=F8C1E2_AFIC5|nr:hypothetical protein OCA4_pOC167B00590 [Afipia carboxidovorans OM4]AEI08257.1 hypothetical protein OCA5_pOC16700590 [Afipia carboxidovorans OM5]
MALRDRDWCLFLGKDTDEHHRTGRFCNYRMVYFIRPGVPCGLVAFCWLHRSTYRLSDDGNGRL